MNDGMKTEDHARQNAAGWYETISELVAALECDYDRLEELRDERDGLAVTFTIWKCDNGTFDFVDEDGNVAYQNLGTDEPTAWAALYTIVNPENAEELATLTRAATIEGEVQTDAESVRERIQEGPLSVDVRSGWYSAGLTEEAPEEFRILLTTGGPALQIRGDLDEHSQPTRAYLQYQDWGTPWTDFFAYGDVPGDPNAYAHRVDSDVLLTYCQQFYFGE